VVSQAPSPDAQRAVLRLREAGCVFAEEEAGLLFDAASGAAELDGLVTRRAAGEPLEQVLGWAEFCGLRIAVEPGVFVPRVRTEWLVQVAARLSPAPSVAVDLCCGTGAVGAALARDLPGLELHAADVDPVAVRCARRNLGERAAVHQGDLYDALPSTLAGRVDLIAANVPYVPSGEIAVLPAEARLHEPREALDGGPDGLALQRRVAAGAPRWLAPGGHVLVEVVEQQVGTALEAFDLAGLDGWSEHSPELDATVAVGYAGSRAVRNTVSSHGGSVRPSARPNGSARSRP
jgi:release factor glutamine methyltransferase